MVGTDLYIILRVEGILLETHNCARVLKLIILWIFTLD